MSEEFCDGVKILLKRMESNPEEFKDSTKWEGFISGHSLIHGYWANVLNPEEVEALRAGVRHIFRDLFTEKVMATLLEDKEETLQGAYRVKEIDSRYANLSARGAVNAVLGGTGGLYQNVYNATSDTSLAAKLKQKLANL